MKQDRLPRHTVHLSALGSHEERGAFTLVELLVTVAIIAILASLLFPAMGRAKQSGYSTVCRNNLRQMGIGISLYASDTSVFPAFYAVDATGRGNNWFKALSRYVVSSWPETDLPGSPNPSKKTPTGVFTCPAYRRLPAYYVNPDSIYTQPFGSYGYNRNGTGGGPFFNECFGLGGAVLATDFVVKSPDDVVYVKENDISVPADFLVFGDSALNWLVPAVGVTTKPTVGHDDFEFGFYTSYIRREIGLNTPNDNNPLPELAAKRRHGAKINTVLADGHVETLKTKQLYGTSPESSRRWNRDGLPHVVH
jgi:prepilin-type N-terminal cleavage/methylation domain-containing protein/prepilin-type processing-associated H-X9-DG protein